VTIEGSYAGQTANNLSIPIKEENMEEHVYKKIEVVGSSKTSVEAAIENAIAKAAETIHNMRWFEVQQTRGYLENGQVSYFQVDLTIGFTVD
jgi:flavin-binding protein dodecin